ARSVVQSGFKAWPRAHRDVIDGDHFPPRRLNRPGLEPVDPALFGFVLVRAGKVVEQVAQRVDAEVGQMLGARRTDAGEGIDGRRQWKRLNLWWAMGRCSRHGGDSRTESTNGKTLRGSGLG